ncbi:MAG TPA: nitronate monooxygenase, partial [Thermoanaerobaculia bacterium]|nr:nitronate monooxygenase [Thermoanaerobaculia bacterium]
LFGTRFVATRESQAPEFWKRAIVEATSEGTVTTDVLSGLYARALSNRFVAEYEESGAPVLPGLLQSNAAQDIYQTAAARGRRDYFPLWAGQSAGLIRDVPAAGEVLRSIVAEAEAAIGGLCR